MAILGALFFPKILHSFAKDIAPIDDSDLQLQKVSVPDQDNAHFDLIKLGSIIYFPKDKKRTIKDMTDGKTWDAQLAEEIVSRNIQAFECFTQAAHKPKYQNPELADPANITMTIEFPWIPFCGQMTEFSTIRALYLAKQGKDKEALDEALHSVHIGQKIQEAQGGLIEHLVATNMKKAGLNAVQKIIPSTKLSSVELKQYAQELNQYYGNENNFIRTLKIEYHAMSSMLDFLMVSNPAEAVTMFEEKESQELELNKKIKDKYYFQPNKTKLLFAEKIRTYIKSVNQSYGEIKTTEMQQPAPTNPEISSEENAVGKYIFSIGSMQMPPLRLKMHQVYGDLSVAVTQAMLAIKAYKNDTNNYPASLNELVPDYLSSVPQDSFDRKPLKYSAAKKILYSVGEDLQDSGGSVGEDLRKMADPTFNLN